MVVDKPITVYRGEIDKSVHMGLSWTSSLEVAEKFASRFSKQGSVLKTVLEPKEILAASDTMASTKCSPSYQKIL